MSSRTGQNKASFKCKHYSGEAAMWKIRKRLKNQKIELTPVSFFSVFLHEIASFCRSHWFPGAFEGRGALCS